MWHPCDGCYGNPRGWDEDDDGFLVGTVAIPECGDGCCWNRIECEDCRGTGLQWVGEADWVDYHTGANLIGAFQSRFAGDPLADVLVAIDHQLSTDSDLDEITGAAKYQALRHEIRTAMAKKLGYSGYRRG